MAAGKLSPRQKMINMMYLVLTALLALNVSKEVLNSFFEVNQGIERTTESLKKKSAETYLAFDAAFELNEIKAGPYKKKAYRVKAKADSLVEFIQKMKYELVLKADGIVYLGLENKDEEGKLIKGKGIEKEWKDLDSIQRTMPIAALSRKDDRNSSGELFYSNKRKKNIATDLKKMILAYKDFLSLSSAGDQSLINSIEETYILADKKGKKGDPNVSWEEYNFYDMPSVGALTLLSNMQLTARNSEADVINMLMENIDKKSLKFTSAEGTQIPKSNFVLQGQTFTSTIFLSAKDTTQEPIIYVGDYKVLENGNYEMIGDSGTTYKKDKVYEIIKPKKGKGIYNRKVSSLSRIGVQKWGGLIAMKTSTGTKTYPFDGEYLVAAKTAVVSPTQMNLLYIEVDNPVEISVPGYQASDLRVSINQGGSIKGGNGKYIVRPGKLTTKGNEAIITVSVIEDGKPMVMGAPKFRVKDVPLPVAKIPGARFKEGAFHITKSELNATGGIKAVLENFEFEGISFKVISFGMMGILKGENAEAESKGPRFTGDMNKIITNTKSGTKITLTNIKATRKGVPKPRDMGTITIFIK